ncbi:uncharacterized protein LOC141697262 [Apium graveolens]|uniref:uncharacterized protein LOC141697262 n=1 Tax=Apium graveolens TaxID=4045 RepID=UPI003D7B7943
MMNMDDKSRDVTLKALHHHQRVFSDVTFHFPTAGIRLGGNSCPDIVQLINSYQLEEIDDTNIDETSSSCIYDNELDYDAFFSQYIDVDNNEEEEKCVINNIINLCGDQLSQGKEKAKDNVLLQQQQQLDNDTPDGPPLSKHSSVARSSSISIQTVETKKAMSAAKLAELWIVDPKRAKRIMANRQSAARSKQRKARYISELERKVKSLQTEATALATQLNVYKEDVVHLAAENKELKLRLQTMEHQAQSQDDITEAMMGELERLRFTSGEIVPSSSLKLGIQSQVHYLLPLQCSAPAAADRQYSFQGLPPRLSCQPIMSHYWPSLHQQ